MVRARSKPKRLLLKSNPEKKLAFIGDSNCKVLGNMPKCQKLLNVNNYGKNGSKLLECKDMIPVDDVNEITHLVLWSGVNSIFSSKDMAGPRTVRSSCAELNLVLNSLIKSLKCLRQIIVLGIRHKKMPNITAATNSGFENAVKAVDESIKPTMEGKVQVQYCNPLMDFKVISEADPLHCSGEEYEHVLKYVFRELH